MEEVAHALRSPYTNNYISLTVPTNMTIDQLRSAVKIAENVVIDLAGTSSVPQSFSTFPINRMGHVCLMLISHSMPDDLANGIEGSILLCMLAAFKFLRQILDRIVDKIRMKRDEFVATTVSYCVRFGPFFVDAVKLRLPMLVRQAFESNPAVPDMSQRLSSLVDIVMTIVATLRDIIGDDAYEQWLEKGKNGNHVCVQEQQDVHVDEQNHTFYTDSKANTERPDESRSEDSEIDEFDVESDGEIEWESPRAARVAKNANVQEKMYLSDEKDECDIGDNDEEKLSTPIPDK